MLSTVHILLYFIIMTCHILFITNIISMYVILINNEKMFVCGLFYNRLLQHYWQTTTSLGLLSWMEMVHYLEHCQGTLEKFYINLLWISPKNMVKWICNLPWSHSSDFLIIFLCKTMIRLSHCIRNMFYYIFIYV